jgi:hypothetical protein
MVVHVVKVAEWYGMIRVQHFWESRPEKMKGHMLSPTRRYTVGEAKSWCYTECCNFGTLFPHQRIV